MDFIDEKGRYHQFQKLCHCAHAPHCGEKCADPKCNCSSCNCPDCDNPNIIKSIS